MAKRMPKELEELRDLSDGDLTKELEGTYRQILTARVQVTTRQLANTSLPHKLRRRVARIKTVQRERQLAAHHTAAAKGSRA